MGGGGGGGDTITNTGLGDDQYQTLADNQVGISGQITTAQDDADAAYNNIYNRFDQSRDRQNDISNAIGSKGYNYDFSNFGDGVTMTNATDALRMAAGLQDQDLSYDVNGDGVVDALDGQGMMSSLVGMDPNSQNTGLYKEFADQTKAMTDQFGNVIAGQGDLNRTIGQQALGTQSAISGNLDTLGQTMGGRFDTLDTGVGNVQGAVDQGFIDQGQRFDTLDTSVGGVQTAVDAGNTANTAGFEANAQGFEDVGKGFEDASGELTETQATILEGQGALSGDLDTMSGNQDTYAAQSLENQGALKTVADGFQTSFDTYTDRYADDQELAQQSRADLATAQANQTDRLREDMGSYAQAAATGQQGLATKLGDVATGVDNQFTQLGADVQGGFVDTQNASLQNAGGVQDAIAANAAATQDQSANILSQLDAGQVTQARDFAKIASAQTDLDANMRSDFNQLGSAFDDNGQLIKSSIDDQGNTITRAMDAQGNLLLRTFDVQGTEIGGGMVNINQRLNELNKLQTMQGGNASMGNLSPAMSSAVPSSGFASPYATTGNTNTALGRDNKSDLAMIQSQFAPNPNA